MLINSQGFNFYYNEDKSQKFRLHPDDVWHIEYPSAHNPVRDFVTECVESAREISLIKKPLLLFSGGADSEVMVRSFHEAGVDFDVCIGTYQGLNDHDVFYAFECCEELGINPILISLDIEKFWQTELDYFSSVSQSFSPQLCTYMKLASFFPDHLVLIGGGENHLVKIEDNWYLSEKEKITSLHKFFYKITGLGWGGFFQWSPNLIRSSLRSMIKFTKKNYTDSKDFKLQFYQEQWAINYRPKFTGFEKVEDLDYFHRNNLKRNHLFGDQIVLTNIQELL